MPQQPENPPIYTCCDGNGHHVIAYCGDGHDPAIAELATDVRQLRAAIDEAKPLIDQLRAARQRYHDNVPVYGSWDELATAIDQRLAELDDLIDDAGNHFEPAAAAAFIERRQDQRAELLPWPAIIRATAAHIAALAEQASRP